MQPKKNLWLIEYDSVFESSSGMQAYSIPDKNNKCYVLTREASLEAVRAEINNVLGVGSHVTTIHKATWLGFVINGHYE